MEFSQKENSAFQLFSSYSNSSEPLLQTTNKELLAPIGTRQKVTGDLSKEMRTLENIRSQKILYNHREDPPQDPHKLLEQIKTSKNKIELLEKDYKEKEKLYKNLSSKIKQFFGENREHGFLDVMSILTESFNDMKTAYDGEIAIENKIVEEIKLDLEDVNYGELHATKSLGKLWCKIM